MARSLGRSTLQLPGAALHGSWHGEKQGPATARVGYSGAVCDSPAAAFRRIRVDGGVALRAVPGQASQPIGKAMRWWEKGVQPNMREVSSAGDLVDSLAAAGNKLVVLEFFSPGCGGCRALHPKICQFAEANPELEFLQVNYEEHKSMCYSLNVHVLPFFRFYRGAQGRLCSFSCTNATVKKFRDALAKHGTDRCSLGPARGLEESELEALGANRDLSFTYTSSSSSSSSSSPPREPEKVITTGHPIINSQEDHAGFASLAR